MAGYPVTGDQYRTIDRKMIEIKRQLNQQNGSSIDPEKVSKELQRIIEMRNDGPLYQSAYGEAHEILKTISRAMAEVGGTDDDLLRVLKDRATVFEIAHAVMGRGAKTPRKEPSIELPPDHYRVFVSYERPSQEWLQKTLHCERWRPSIFDGRPWDRHHACQNIDETPGQRVFWVAKPRCRGRDPESVIKWAAKLRYRPVIETELIAFGFGQPDLPKQWVLALGASALGDEGEKRYAAMLRYNTRGRELVKRPASANLLPCCRVLLVRDDT